MKPFFVWKVDFDFSVGLVCIIPNLIDFSDIKVSCRVWPLHEHSNIVIVSVKLVRLHVNLCFHIFEDKHLTFCSYRIGEIAHIERIGINLEPKLMIFKERVICCFFHWISITDCHIAVLFWILIIFKAVFKLYTKGAALNCWLRVISNSKLLFLFFSQAQSSLSELRLNWSFALRPVLSIFLQEFRLTFLEKICLLLVRLWRWTALIIVLLR